MEDPLLIPLAALQHYAFCPRQCALIHMEGIWADNWHTAQGELLHERVHASRPERRGGIRQEFGVAVCAPTLGVTGKLDLLEIGLPDGALHPVEYKKGKTKPDDRDRVQLCAQVLCLEEMTGRRIDTASLWYWQTRRREPVPMTEALRQRTQALIREIREMLLGGVLPAARVAAHCRSCSLCEDCAPQWPNAVAIRSYMAALFADGESADEEIT